MKNTQVSVCLIAKAGGTNLKPFIAFKDAKHDLISLKDEFKTRCGVASLSNGQMNNDFDN